ncbi:MAG: 50S ribosomal protein L15 [Patescibacteria group bacterium]|nr:50S ribosomal protein L15 [Patescibacteria group bacterium]
MLQQNTLKPNPGSSFSRKRVGRGNGSGLGTYSGRGCNGQNARSGGGVRHGFEGGQTSLIQRMPKKRGFRNPNRKENQPVSLSSLNRFEEGTVTKLMMKKAGLIGSEKLPVKILANGEVSKKLVIEAEKASKLALESLSKAGSSLSLS